MRPFLWPLAFIAIGAGAVALQAAAASQETVVDRIEEAKKLNDGGKREEALAALDVDDRHVQDLAPGLRADLLLNRAAVQEEAGDRSAAVDSYRDAIAVEGLDVQTRNLAFNNLGNVLLAIDSVKEALGAFAEIRLDAESERRKAIYLTNHGYAKEVAGDLEQAVELYERALKADPSARVAASSMFSLYARRIAEDITEVVTTIRTIAERGQHEVAGSLAADEIGRETWSAAGSYSLLAAFVFAEAQRGVSFGDHPFELDAALRSMEKARPYLLPALNEIRRAYFSTSSDDENLIFERKADVKRYYPFWSSSDFSSDFSALLASLASYHRLKEDLPRALSYYSAAWQIDNSNSLAAVHAWTILAADPDLSDSAKGLHSRLSVFFRSDYYGKFGKTSITDADRGSMALTLLLLAERSAREGDAERANAALREAQRLLSATESVPGDIHEQIDERIGLLCSERTYKACGALQKQAASLKADREP